MPTHKGIKLSLVSQWELKVHPEFPHPDSSQFTYRSPDLRKLDPTDPEEFKLPSAASDSKADRLLGRQSCVSVYTPSLSGARFWVKYTITEPTVAHSQWYYFKLLMNGRHITSWGTNARTKPDGQVMRGLFEPSERWNYKNEGTIYKNMGTEARPFYFGNEDEVKSAANDGGLIEVLVFRARGRKRRLASPEEFKNQEVYGIVMPSGGLLDRPQDARFYDWHLKDPKDAPFAVFKFHYRSWDSLQSLQLIPADHPRELLQSSPSLLSISGGSQELHDRLDQDGSDEDEDEDERKVEEEIEEDVDTEEENETPALDLDDITRESIASEISSTPWLTNVFDDVPHTNVTFQERRGLQHNISLIHTDPRKREIPLSRFSNAAVDRPKTPETPDHPPWQHILDRPLPKIPERISSKKQSLHSRNSSSISTTPSVTPSLMEYLERDTNSPEPLLGIARAVEVQRVASGKTETSIDDFVSLSSADQFVDAKSEFSSPPSQTLFAKRQGVAMESSSLNDFFNLPNISNITVRKHKRLSAKSLPRLSIPTSPTTRILGKLDTENDEGTPSAVYNMSTLSLSESEWMCRTPSPLRKDSQHNKYQRMWSPSPGAVKKVRRGFEQESLWSPTPASGKRFEKQKIAGALRRNTMEWYDQVKNARDDDANTSFTVEDMDDDTKVQTGWI